MQKGEVPLHIMGSVEYCFLRGLRSYLRPVWGLENLQVEISPLISGSATNSSSQVVRGGGDGLPHHSLLPWPPLVLLSLGVKWERYCPFSSPIREQRQGQRWKEKGNHHAIIKGTIKGLPDTEILNTTLYDGLTKKRRVTHILRCVVPSSSDQIASTWSPIIILSFGEEWVLLLRIVLNHPIDALSPDLLFNDLVEAVLHFLFLLLFALLFSSRSDLCHWR